MTERTCVGCGALLPPNKYQGPPRKWCSPGCGQYFKRNSTTRPPQDRPCEFCGNSMAGQQVSALVCSPECKKEADRRRALANPNYGRHEPRERTCAVCGSVFVQLKQETCCSRECRYAKSIKTRGFTSAWRRCEVCGDRYRYSFPQQRTCGRKCGRIIQDQNRTTAMPTMGPHSHVFYRRCLRCVTDFATSSPARRFCSSACSKADNIDRSLARYYHSIGQPDRAPNLAPRLPLVTTECPCSCWRNGGHVARAKYYGTQWETIDTQAVFDRDAWICGICGEGIDRDAKAPDPWSPSLDHVVPLSRGGAHTYDNVQASHLWCNGAKNNDEQFTLRTA